MANKGLLINNFTITYSMVYLAIYIIFREFVYNIYLLSTALGPFSSILMRSAVGRHSNYRQAKPNMASARRKQLVGKLSVTRRWRHDDVIASWFDGGGIHLLIYVFYTS